MKTADLFTCPQCGKHKLKEVRSVFSFHEVTEVGKKMEYGAINLAPTGDIERYECADCDYRINFDNPEQLWAYIVDMAVHNWDISQCQKFLEFELGIDCNTLDYLADDVEGWRDEVSDRMEEFAE